MATAPGELGEVQPRSFRPYRAAAELAGPYKPSEIERGRAWPLPPGGLSESGGQHLSNEAAMGLRTPGAPLPASPSPRACWHRSCGRARPLTPLDQREHAGAELPPTPSHPQDLLSPARAVCHGHRRALGGLLGRGTSAAATLGGPGSSAAGPKLDHQLPCDHLSVTVRHPSSVSQGSAWPRTGRLPAPGR